MTTINPINAPPERVSLGQTVPVPSHVLPSHATISQTSLNGATSSQGPSSSHSGPQSSSLVNPTTLALSLPHSTQSLPIIQVDSQALHYLTLEMPNTLRAGAKKSLRRRKRGVASLREAGFNVDGMLGPADATTPEELEGEVIIRLEAIGSHVGANFAERLSRDRTSFLTTLDVLKFICKDVWTAIWDKQVDNLRTNHRGVYVLQDNHFKPLFRLSLPNSPTVSQELVTISKLQLAFPVGIIRGALARLGVTSSVVAETNQIPQCTFHVKTTTQRP
ncbi:hypothetical protein CBS101457_003638 [Exobasidium rhododendri]|nr:hypothetical protein CBS101457_003638 [Exobasidium rhododendri]